MCYPGVCTNQECYHSNLRHWIPVRCQSGYPIYHDSCSENRSIEKPCGYVAKEGKVYPDLDSKVSADVVYRLRLVPGLPVYPLFEEELSLAVNDTICLGVVGTLHKQVGI